MHLQGDTELIQPHKILEKVLQIDYNQHLSQQAAQRQERRTICQNARTLKTSAVFTKITIYQYIAELFTFSFGWVWGRGDSI